MKIVFKLKKLFIKLLNEAKVIFYITGKNQLPPPLSKKEERKLLERYQNGDIEARNKLIEHNLRLVAHIVKKFDSGTYLIDDLISVGSMGLIKAIDSFKLDKDIKLATYASRCIENEILMMFRRLSKHKNNVSLSDVLKIDSEGNELVLSDLIKASEEELSEKFERAEEKRLVLESVKSLTEREYSIISKRYGLFGERSQTQKEIADELGISQSYISRIEKKALKKLEAKFDKAFQK